MFEDINWLRLFVEQFEDKKSKTVNPFKYWLRLYVEQFEDIKTSQYKEQKIN